MRPKVKKQFEWSEQFKPQVRESIKKVASKIINIRDATKNEDMKEATDMVVTADLGTIAVRVRSNKFKFGKYKDVTLRSYSNGNNTEIHKLREGWGDWYLYAWNEFEDWVFYDINKLRKNRPDLLKENIVKQKEISNYDGNTKLYPISVKDLFLADTIVGGSRKVARYCSKYM